MVNFTSETVFTVHSFAGDHWTVCKDYVRSLLGLPHEEWRRELREPLSAFAAVNQAPDPTVHKREFALRMWNAAQPPTFTPVQRYLESRGLDLFTAGLAHGDVIRFMPFCPFKLEDEGRTHHPAMVCLFRDILTDEPRAIQRTALAADGNGKAKIEGLDPKQMLAPVKGCAIKLSPDHEVTEGIAIAEGVENALTALCGGLAPVWALGSAGAVEAFPVLPGVEAITILADHDRAGIEAARKCAHRWADEGREAIITYPPKPGADWNDMRAAS
ncbi:toprim domain-containing protein [Aestuariivirga sp.]|uniref:DUF7146 domain-containing protein n=1 Tax=Aestuariivirga sp. TaxID=2650926 RepID=UPI003593827B